MNWIEHSADSTVANLCPIEQLRGPPLCDGVDGRWTVDTWALLMVASINGGLHPSVQRHSRKELEGDAAFLSEQGVRS